MTYVPEIELLPDPGFQEYRLLRVLSRRLVMSELRPF